MCINSIYSQVLDEGLRGFGNAVDSIDDAEDGVIYWLNPLICLPRLVSKRSEIRAYMRRQGLRVWPGSEYSKPCLTELSWRQQALKRLRVKPPRAR